MLVSRSVLGESRGLSGIVDYPPPALELLQKYMNTLCMLTAWIESHDSDVKEVRLDFDCYHRCVLDVFSLIRLF